VAETELSKKTASNATRDAEITQLRGAVRDMERRSDAQAALGRANEEVVKLKGGHAQLKHQAGGLGAENRNVTSFLPYTLISPRFRSWVTPLHLVSLRFLPSMTPRFLNGDASYDAVSIIQLTLVCFCSHEPPSIRCWWPRRRLTGCTATAFACISASMYRTGGCSVCGRTRAGSCRLRRRRWRAWRQDQCPPRRHPHCIPSHIDLILR